MMSSFAPNNLKCFMLPAMLPSIPSFLPSMLTLADWDSTSFRWSHASCSSYFSLLHSFFKTSSLDQHAPHSLISCLFLKGRRRTTWNKYVGWGFSRGLRLLIWTPAMSLCVLSLMAHMNFVFLPLQQQLLPSIPLLFFSTQRPSCSSSLILLTRLWSSVRCKDVMWAEMAYVPARFSPSTSYLVQRVSRSLGHRCRTWALMDYAARCFHNILEAMALYEFVMRSILVASQKGSGRDREKSKDHRKYSKMPMGY